MHFGTLKRLPPKSNLQRQREFRERHPHYYRDLHRKRKAEREAAAALVAQHPELTFVQAYAIIKGEAPAPGIKAPAPGIEATAPAEQPTTPLALPAARSEPLVTVQLPLFEQAPEPVEARPKLTPADVVQHYKDAA